VTSAFHDFEHEQWQGAVDAYHAGWGGLTTQTIPAVLDALGVAAGTRLLDVASGPGYLAAAAAACGAGAVGLDFSAAMVARARALHPAVAFQEGDAVRLPFPGAEFDAVAMNFGILHLGRPEAAIAEAARVLRPGGRYGFTAWADPGRAAGFALVLDAVRRCGLLPVQRARHVRRGPGGGGVHRRRRPAAGPGVAARLARRPVPRVPPRHRPHGRAAAGPGRRGAGPDRGDGAGGGRALPPAGRRGGGADAGPARHGHPRRLNGAVPD